MAYDGTKKLTLAQAKTIADRIQTEYQEYFSDNASGLTSDDVATDEEVAEMLDEVFSASETDATE